MKGLKILISAIFVEKRTNEKVFFNFHHFSGIEFL